MAERSEGSEFRAGWPAVLAAAAGVGLGISGLLTYNSGLFVPGLSREVGLSRTAYGAVFFGSTVALAVAMPAVGRAVGRFGTRPTAAFGAAALALGFVALSQVRSVAMYAAAMIAMGLFASASAPVPYTRAVAARFARARGLALGLTQLGIGLAAAVIPPLVGATIAKSGWRSGFLVLAGFATLGLLPALLLRSPEERSEGTGSQAFTSVRRSSAYRVQVAAFTSMAFAFSGMLSHFVPMLTDAGVPIARAGALAGMIGVSVIVSRVIVGWLADRLEPAWLGAASCALCALGCVALAVGGVRLAPIGALAFGAAMGAEADLIAILTARNFPLAAYSRAYSAQYGAFMIAGGVSPLWIGFMADRAGGYHWPLFACAALLAVPIALFLMLPLRCAAAVDQIILDARNKNS